jgi:hypothetical protein
VINTPVDPPLGIGLTYHPSARPRAQRGPQKVLVTMNDPDPVAMFLNKVTHEQVRHPNTSRPIPPDTRRDTCQP